MSIPWGGFVILGHPVAHSLSPTFQNAALEAIGARQQYERLDVPPAALAQTVATLGVHRIAGNVTIPHKEAMAGLASRLTETAQATGAVNTFWWDAEGLVGHNTDVLGAEATIRALLPNGAQGPVVVLGAGGSSAAVLHALRLCGCSDVHMVARTPARATALLERMTISGAVHAEDATGALAPALLSVLQDAALVVNCTPVGLSGDQQPIALDAIGTQAAIFDLVYRRTGTAWVREAQHQQRRAEDGMRMLVEQGAAAFEAWTGVAAPRDVMWRALGGTVPDAQTPRMLAPTT
ncbi:MAG: shikimate dehydrogenase [Gemmatimonadaceae bacterium]|nr:shikimate dehydrogenase [Gemmatimonadaceae bacterium]